MYDSITVLYLVLTFNPVKNLIGFGNQVNYKPSRLSVV